MSRDNKLSSLTDDDLNIRLESEENDLKDLEGQKDNIEIDIKDIEEDADLLHGKEIKKFKRVMQEMEEAERAIVQKKEDLRQKISAEQKKYKYLTHCLDITVEDRESTTDQIHDL